MGQSRQSGPGSTGPGDLDDNNDDNNDDDESEECKGTARFNDFSMSECMAELIRVSEVSHFSHRSRRRYEELYGHKEKE